MEMQLDKGCCNMPLRKSCIVIAVYFFIAILLTLCFDLNTNVIPLILLVLTTIANLSLFVGALIRNKFLVFVWLAIELIYFINWPIEVFGIIFDFGGYRTGYYKENVFLVVFVTLIDLIINLYCSLIVYSFHRELKNAASELRSVPMA